MLHMIGVLFGWAIIIIVVAELFGLGEYGKRGHGRVSKVVEESLHRAKIHRQQAQQARAKMPEWAADWKRIQRTLGE